MASKSTSTKNPERCSGKAWGKNHNNIKVKPSPSAEKVAAREARRAVSAGGAPVTMPSITWEWAGRVMSSRWPSTRKVNAVDAYLAWEKGKSPARKEEDGVVLVSENNLETKISSARPSRKSLARAGTADRKNGR